MSPLLPPSHLSTRHVHRHGDDVGDFGFRDRTGRTSSAAAAINGFRNRRLTPVPIFPRFCLTGDLGGGVASPELQESGPGMNEDAEAARRYRNRAKEVRAIAEGAKDRESRLSLLRVARDYERMARLRIAVGKADRDSSSARHSNEPEV